MLRAEVYAHAMRASQNRKMEVRKFSCVLTSESGGRAIHTLIVAFRVFLICCDHHHPTDYVSAQVYASTRGGSTRFNGI